MKLHPMWKNYPVLQADLKKTIALMEKSLQLKNKHVQQAILEMIHSGGKLLRPAYQLLFSEFGSERNQKKSIALAAAIEMLHTATLIHDDIVDEAVSRRNLPTIRTSFGNDVAVYAGDYLFVCCFKLMADYAGTLKSLQLNSRSMEKILSGELGQMNNRYNPSLTIKEYLENISGKTAELFSLSCFIGAYESGTSLKFANQAKEIGLNIGIAFQIIDDVLDYSQSADSLGKPVLEDVRQGIYSLPLLCGIKNNPSELLPLLAKKEQLTTAEIQEVYDLVHRSHGVEEAQETAAAYTQTALQLIDTLPDNATHTKENLQQITRSILTRTN